MSAARVNMHVFVSDVVNETRLFKEVRYTLREEIFDHVIVCGLWAEGLARQEKLSSGLEIRRKVTWIRRPMLRKPLLRMRPLYALVAAWSLVQYAMFVLMQARRLRPSHVSCHNVMLLPLSILAAWLAGGQLIYLPHELETERASTSGKRQALERWIERKLIHKAEQIVVVCDPIADWYAQQYDLHNIHVLRNMPEKEALVCRDIGNKAFRHVFDIPPAATVFIYQGVMGAARGTPALLEIFGSLDAERAHLVLMGYGDPASDAVIHEACARCTNIHYHPAVPIDVITSYTAGADVGLFITQEEALSYRMSLPNKFFEYIHAGLPVLLTDNLEYMRDILTRNNLGWAVPVDEIRNKIDVLSQRPLEQFSGSVAQYAASAVWESDAKILHRVYV